jgi:hypothetical protein
MVMWCVLAMTLAIRSNLPRVADRAPGPCGLPQYRAALVRNLTVAYSGLT